MKTEMNQTPNKSAASSLADDGRQTGIEARADQNASIKAIRLIKNDEIEKTAAMFADTSNGTDDLISHKTKSIDNTAIPISRLLRLPLELQISIIKLLDSAKDILSLQLTHPSLRQLLTGPYSPDIYSAIAFGRWAPKGGLSFLDILCNGLVNQSRKGVLQTYGKTYCRCCSSFNGVPDWKLRWRPRPWPLIPSHDTETKKLKIQSQFRM